MYSCATPTGEKGENMSRQLTLKVKAINQRYKDLVNTFGLNSEPVTEYQQIIKQISTRGETQSGYLAIKTPSKLTAEDIKQVNKLYLKRTTSAYKLDYMKTIVADKLDKNPYDVTLEEIDEYKNTQVITGEQIREVGKLMNDLHSIIENYAQLIYNTNREITNHLHQKKGKNHLSLSEVAEIKDIVDGKRKTFEEQWEDLHYTDEVGRYPNSAEYVAWARGFQEFEQTGNDTYEEELQNAIKDGYKTIEELKRS